MNKEKLMGVLLGRGLPVSGQPLLHHRDLVDLRQLDALPKRPHLRTSSAGLQQFDHLHGLRVVPDHPLHEPNVSGREADLRQIDRTGRRLAGLALDARSRGAA